MNSFNTELRYNLKLNFNFSIGVFLFILFFRPFEASYNNVNNLIIFFSGFSGILFIFNNLFYIVVPSLFPQSIRIKEWDFGPPILLSSLALVFNSVAFTFYLRYVGKTSISFYIVFKIVIIYLSVVVIMRMLYRIRSQYNQLIGQSIDIDTSAEPKIPNKIELSSENNSEKIELSFNNILTIKAADNYVEINYQHKDEIRKKLLRNSLKNIESQLALYSNFVRCHRTFIVNLNNVKRLARNYTGTFLELNNKEHIPVSRHYLLKVKEQLKVK
ncbi:MAG: LytTR family transcriptional regulator DNA-binding domain-containing protein [Bacteroidetes bacterium]|nr:LytTR family transcriptional regulator DNA-binding domain-containing protein [Bacteroidota bacterium]